MHKSANHVCSIDHLIDQVDMPEIDREAAKAQVHRVEVLFDGIAACTQGIRRLFASESASPAAGLRQH